MRSFNFVVVATLLLTVTARMSPTAHAYTLQECRWMFDCPEGGKISLIADLCFCCEHAIAECNVAHEICADPTNCAACDASNGECTACQPGYSVSGGLCKPACTAPHCAVCVENSATDCKTCEDGYVWSGTACEAPASCTVSNCETCKPGSSTVCASCGPGYKPSSTGTSCARVCYPSYCSECVAASSEECKICQPGYSLTYAGTCQRRKSTRPFWRRFLF